MATAVGESANADQDPRFRAYSSVRGGVYSSLQRLSSDLLKLFNREDHHDIVMNIDGRAAYAHKALLEIRSPFFSQLFEEMGPAAFEHPIVDISGMQYGTFTTMLKYIYTGRLYVTTENVIGLYEAAHRFELPEIEKMCDDFMITNKIPNPFANVIKTSALTDTTPPTTLPADTRPTKPLPHPPTARKTSQPSVSFSEDTTAPEDTENPTSPRLMRTSTAKLSKFFGSQENLVRKQRQVLAAAARMQPTPKIGKSTSFPDLESNPVASLPAGASNSLDSPLSHKSTNHRRRPTPTSKAGGVLLRSGRSGSANSIPSADDESREHKHTEKLSKVFGRRPESIALAEESFGLMKKEKGKEKSKQKRQKEKEKSPHQDDSEDERSEDSERDNPRSAGVEEIISESRVSSSSSSSSSSSGTGIGNGLSSEEIAELVRVTSFTGPQIKQLYKRFTKFAEDGVLYLGGFARYLRMGSDAPFLNEILFQVFDIDGDGVISFRDMALTLSKIKFGAVEERAEIYFKIYDLDKNGSLSKDEVLSILRAIYDKREKEVDGVTKTTLVDVLAFSSPERHAWEIFRRLQKDIDKDAITLAEFKAKAKGDPDFLALFKVFSFETKRVANTQCITAMIDAQLPNFLKALPLQQDKETSLSSVFSL